MPEVTKVYPFHHDKIYDQQSDNVLLRQVNFPFKFNKNDTIGSEWSDRQYHNWVKAVGKYNKTESFIGMIFRLSEEEFLDFCSIILGVKGISGARLVKFVHGQSGFCVWRVDYYISKKPVKGHSDSRWAPNIIQSENSIDDWNLFEDVLFGWRK